MNQVKYWILVTSLMAISASAFADSLDEQRQRYDQVRQAWDSNQMTVVDQLMPTLRDYPLYPYLEYRQLAANLSQDSALAINNFTERYPTLPLGRSLHNRFINELARRQDWQGLLNFSPAQPSPVQAQCNWYYAKWATGDQQTAWRGATKLWQTGHSLPKACDTLFNIWRSSRNVTPETILTRILLAVKAGNSGLVNHLVTLLPADYNTVATALSQLQQTPQAVVSFAKTVSPSDFSRQITINTLSRLARQDFSQAQTLISTLSEAQKMSATEQQLMAESVVWQMMGADLTSEQQRWRDRVVIESDSLALLERRIRLALSENDRPGLNTWIARLPLEAKQKDEWQYWQADLLFERGRDKEAKELLHQLIQQRGFYPMVAAQRLDEHYPLKIDPVPATDPHLTQGAEIARVRELMYWGLDNLARNEWTNLIQSYSRSEQQMLANYANQQGWWDLGVQATITAKMWDSLRQRFPLAWQSDYRRFTQGKGISSSYAMAISRQESAWNPKIMSPVGATGLMQLMPATASNTAKMFGISGYNNSRQLLDPLMNIEIGTQYLDYLYNQFSQNRILSSAAYNAGPSHVNRWLTTSNSRLNAIAFIETIPFAETRNYIKNVLAYDVYYRYFLGQQDKILQDTEWNHRY